MAGAAAAGPAKKRKESAGEQEDQRVGPRSPARNQTSTGLTATIAAAISSSPLLGHLQAPLRPAR